MPQETFDEYLRRTRGAATSEDPAAPAAPGATGIVPWPSSGPAYEVEKPFLSGSNAFLKLLDALNTPQQMMFGAVKGAAEGRPLLESAMEGAREDISFSELLPEGMDPYSKGALGFAGDVVLDPVNLIPVLKGGKLLARGVTKGIEAAAATKVGKKLIGTPLEREFKRLAREVTTEVHAKKMEHMGTALKETEILEGISKKYNKSTDDLLKMLADEIEIKKPSTAAVQKATRLSPGAAADMAEDIATITAARSSVAPSVTAPIQSIPEIAEMAGRIRNSLDEIFMGEQMAKLGTVRLQELDLEYLTHMLTDDAKKLIMRKDPLWKAKGLVWTARHANQLQREFRGMTINQINELAAKGKLPGHIGNRIPKFFDDNPIRVSAIRLLRGEKAIGDAEMYMRAAANMGHHMTLPATAELITNDPNRWVKLAISRSTDKRVAPLAKYLDQFYFDKDVAKHMDAIYDATLNPKSWMPGSPELNPFLKVFDGVQDVWKKYTLMVWPAYHARNVVGNVWNNFLGGIANPQEYARAIKFQFANNDTIFRVGSFEMTKADWLKTMHRYGVAGEEQFSRYMSISTATDLFGKPLKKENAFLRTGMKAGNWLEDNARITHFWNKVENAAPNADNIFSDAAWSVKKYLFDYGDLLDVEKGVLRRVFPFYSWTRKNLPLQIRSLVEQPHKFNILGDMVNAARVDKEKEISPQEYAYVADWVKDNSGIQIRMDENGKPQFFLLGGWIPAADIQRMGDLKQLILDNLSPIPKSLVEYAANKSLFLGADIQDFPGEVDVYFGVPVSKQITNAFRNVRILAEIDRLLATFEKSLAAGGTNVNLSNREGEDWVGAAMRLALGAKAHTIDLQRGRAVRTYHKRDLIRKLRSAASRGDTANVEVLRGLIDEMNREETPNLKPVKRKI